MSAAPPESGVRVRPLAESPALLERAAKMLARPSAIVPFTLAEAGLVAARMGLATFQPGVPLIREGSDRDTGHLLLLLEGEVNVDTGGAAATGAAGAQEGVAVSVLGPGDIIGEMALIDGAARSASCVAANTVQAAGLSRAGLTALLNDQPVVAAKLMTVLASRIAERLRALGQQLQMYAQLSARQEDELRRLRGGR